MLAPTAAPDDTRLCTDCHLDRPLSMFRWRNRAAGVKHHRCRDCRQRIDSSKRNEERKRSVQRALRDMRRSETPRQLSNVMQTIAERVGGLPSLIQLWVEMISDKRASGQRRLSSMQTLLHVLMVCDLRSFQQQAQATPAAVVAALHRQGELVPILRRMLNEGALTLDQLDPPPAA